MWIPTRASGYTAEEMRDMAAAGKLVGVSKWELDTPALCVDLDKLRAEHRDDEDEAGRRRGVASRPHAKTHKCPAIAKLQLARRLDRRLRGEDQRGRGALRANGVEQDP